MVVVPWLEQNHAKDNSSPSWFTMACPSLPCLFLHHLLLTEAIDKTSVFLPQTESSLVKWFHVACVRLTFQLPYTGACVGEAVGDDVGDVVGVGVVGYGVGDAVGVGVVGYGVGAGVDAQKTSIPFNDVSSFPP